MRLLLKPLIWLFKNLVVEVYAVMAGLAVILLIALLPFPIYLNFIPGIVLAIFAYKGYSKLVDWEERKRK